MKLGKRSSDDAVAVLYGIGDKRPDESWLEHRTRQARAVADALGVPFEETRLPGEQSSSWHT